METPRANENILVKFSGGKWSVFSPTWEVGCVDEASAFKIKKIVEDAYVSGAEDVREDLYEVITPQRLLAPRTSMASQPYTSN